MKKSLIFTVGVLCALLLLSLSAFGAFEDVAEGKWYSEGIDFCAANEYMSGTSADIFDRNSTLTRAMFMTILAKVDGADLTEHEGKSSFADIRSDGWYTSAVEWAYRNQLAGGIGNDKDGNPTFGYKNPVTREQMALVLYSYAEYLNFLAFDVAVPDIPIEYSAPIIDTASRADLSVFTDSDRVHDWAKDAMEWAVSCGLLGGVEETLLDPRGNCTRAQTAVIIRSFVLNLISDCSHDWEQPSCTTGGQCNLCGLYNRQALGHTVGDRVCTEPAECSVCHEIVEGVEHKYAPADCLSPKTCKKCGHTDGDPLGHTVTNGYCTRCKTENFTDAHQQLLYHLRKDGKKEGNIRYFENPNVADTGKMKDQLYVVYAVDNDDSVFMQFSYTTSSGDFYLIELELEDIGHPYYHFVDFRIKPDGIYRTCRAGTVWIDTLDSQGRCTIDDYGNSDNQFSHDNSAIPHLFFRCSRLMQAYAGVNLGQYGFNMAEITKNVK